MNKKGSGIALGIAIGTAIGVALDNIGVWLSIGIALGAGLEIRIKPNKDAEEEK